MLVESWYVLPDAGRAAMLYTVRPGGSVQVSLKLEVAGGDLPKIPRFGTQLTLPVELRNAAWYGRGPHESYADRKTSARVARYSGPVDAMFHRYSRPQETGNLTDTRWMAVTGEDGLGLLAVMITISSVRFGQFTPA